MSTDSPIQYNPDRVLTQAQKDINDDHHYWDWFDAWWDQDFSWDGLIEHEIEGWDDGRTLQDYWREEEDKLIEFAGRKWTRFHLPMHDLSGKEKTLKFSYTNETWVEEWWQRWRTEFLVRLQDARKYADGIQDSRAQFTGICTPGFWHIWDNPTRKNIPKLHENLTLHLRADWAQFGNYTSFQGITFESDTDFNNAQFREYALFCNSHFEQESYFCGAQFGDSAQFDNAVFEGLTHFSLAIFGKFTRFFHTTFLSQTLFGNVQFGVNPTFEQARFHGLTHFLSSSPQANDSKFELTGSQFIDAKFFGDVLFMNRVFQFNTNFTNAEFHKLAKFHGCEFHQDTSFAEANFSPPEKSEDAEKYERAFRTLKQLMKKNDASAEVFRFSKLEMQARERRIDSNDDVPRWVRVWSRIYGFIADYGQNALWPLIWLSAAWLFASIGYSAIAQINHPIAHSFGDAASVAFQYSLPPVSTFAAQFFAGEVDQGFINALLDHPFLTRLVMVTHGVISLALVFFLLLALKRRFQIR